MLVSGNFSYQDKKAVPLLVGGEPDLNLIELYDLQKGRFIDKNDLDEKRKVVVIGKTVASDLFEEKDPLGKKVKINQEEFEVIGVIKTESVSNIGIDANLLAVIPISVSKEMFKTNRVNRILLQVKTKNDINRVQKEVADLLKKRHQNNEDFSVLTQKDILTMFDEILSLVTALLSGIAAISLIVGGVGIMNIMLVSVTERTREIGIRKAVGATSGNILVQFLIEAAVISLIGGGIGVVISFIVSFLVGIYTPINPEITLWAILLAFGVSVGVGIIFGIMPAIKAARKNPIEALRYE